MSLGASPPPPLAHLHGDLGALLALLCMSAWEQQHQETPAQPQQGRSRQQLHLLAFAAPATPARPQCPPRRQHPPPSPREPSFPRPLGPPIASLMVQPRDGRSDGFSVGDWRVPSPEGGGKADGEEASCDKGMPRFQPRIGQPGGPMRSWHGGRRRAHWAKWQQRKGWEEGGWSGETTLPRKGRARNGIPLRSCRGQCR